MQNLPHAALYESEISYMPWQNLRDKVVEKVIAEAPQGGKVLDLLCGPGYILGKIFKARSDLSCLGIDLESEYVEYARSRHPGIEFAIGDVMTWDDNTAYDIVLCTAGVHHLPYEEQQSFVAKMAKLTTDTGTVIIGDLYIDEYANEQQRKIAAAHLGYEYLKETIEKGAPNDIIQTAIDVMANDIMMVECKTSVAKMRQILEQSFSHVQIYKTWPAHDSEYGDYYWTLRK